MPHNLYTTRVMHYRPTAMLPHDLKGIINVAVYSCNNARSNYIYIIIPFVIIGKKGQ